jgi:hypothetical protein
MSLPCGEIVRRVSGGTARVREVLEVQRESKSATESPD